MDNEPNRKCVWCKKPYYSCDASSKYGHWKAICCTPECFQAYMIYQEQKQKDNKK